MVQTHSKKSDRRGVLWRMALLECVCELSKGVLQRVRTRELYDRDGTLHVLGAFYGRARDV